MIKVNHLSEKVYHVMVTRFGIGKHSSMTAWLLHLSQLWRDANQATQKEECSRFAYSELELILADMMLLIIALLHKLGVRNIENLLRRRIADNDRDNKKKSKE